ncbi:RICIN domain-containing protein [Streptomyces decoyicus]|uniref:RICIN domain-containing protein n=1 Tax=Streptomyces decoyicus TaxID=249567 RepID=UPI002E362029|nr:RICIN domain-containing protein [Streptomyces decoyicus]
MGLALAPLGASAGDCDNFPGGVCPPFSNPRQPPVFGDGWWNIKSAFTNDLVVDAPVSGAVATLERNRNGESQQFRFRPKGGGQYQIELRSTGLCLEGSDDWKDGRALVHANTCDAQTSYQFWKIEPHPKGFFRIRRSAGAFRCLDAHNPALTAPPRGTHVQEWTCHDRENQAWTFVDASPAPPVH